MKRAFLVVGLGFGDEGKGAVVDAIVHREGAQTIVRFNGGAQAAHHVVTPDGRTHCFSQFGAGTLARDGVRTYLARTVVVDPPAIAREAAALVALGVPHPKRLLSVDLGCPVATPWHINLGRLRECARGKARHGSTGRGIGEVQRDRHEGRDVVTVADLVVKPEIGRQRLETLASRYRREAGDLMASVPGNETPLLAAIPTPQQYVDLCRSALDGVRGATGPMDLVRDEVTTVVFEGAQGVLLDAAVGFHPYTTWSDTTLRYAYDLLSLAAWPGAVVRVGVLRTYATRHGAGPLPTENWDIPIAATEHNTADPWQGGFRTGWFDAVLARYALRQCAVDLLALTHLDETGDDKWRAATSYTTRDGDTLTDIAPEATLKQQEALTHVLSGVKPGYIIPGGGDREAVKRTITSLLRTHIGIECYGPTRATTVFTSAWPVMAPATEIADAL